LNEDLAATSVWGSQQVGMFPGATAQGVFGIWYGKGPGVNRSADALKHANAAGTSRYGGVLALAGDDHGCQSSTLAHQSEQIFQAAMMPILNPATVQEYLDFGIYGFALSRYSGCWIGFKAISETAESSASITVDPQRMQFVEPADFVMPSTGVHIRWPDPPLEAEKRLHGPKMQAVAAFARAELVKEYIAQIDDLIGRLTPQNHALAVEVLRLPDSIRGFGHVKEKSVHAARERKAALLAAFESGVAVAAE
jgi:indolepyruvate ferredoxin oxidoreductase